MFTVSFWVQHHERTTNGASWVPCSLEEWNEFKGAKEARVANDKGGPPTTFKELDELWGWKASQNPDNVSILYK